MATDKTQDIDLAMERREWGKPDGRLQHAVLAISTGKHYNGGVASSARVYWLADHSRSHAFGLAGGGDYSIDVRRATAARATQKAIDRQHAEVFTPEFVATLVSAAKSHYGSSEESKNA